MVRFWGSIVGMLVVAVLALDAVTPVGAQSRALSGADGVFRVEWEQTTTKRGTVLRGYVWNDHGYAAGNIRLLVEGLDGGGAVATTTLRWVLEAAPAFNRAYFEFPLSAPAASYRVRVAGWETIGRGGP